MTRAERITRLIAPGMIGALAALSVMIAAPASAGEVEASKLSYTNKGGYTATFRVEIEREFAGNLIWCRIEPKAQKEAALLETRTIDLTKGSWTVVRGVPSCLTSEKQIPDGVEVWGRISIKHGDSKSCRKDTRIIYRMSGGKVQYTSAGTTTNNNRCKVSSWP